MSPSPSPLPPVWTMAWLHGICEAGEPGGGDLGMSRSCPPVWAGIGAPLLHYCRSQVKLSSCIKMGVSVSLGRREQSPEERGWQQARSR